MSLGCVLNGVYFIQALDGGPVKIGHSKDATRRLGHIQISSPVPLQIVALMPGTRQHELQLHYRFGQWRLYGEWFEEDAPGLADLIAEYRVDHPPAGQRRRAVLRGGGRSHVMVRPAAVPAPEVVARPKELVTVAGLARELSVSTRTVGRLVDDGTFPFTVVDGVRMFDAEAIIDSLRVVRA